MPADRGLIHVFGFAGQWIEVDCGNMRRSSEKDDADLTLMRRVAEDEEAAVAELYDRFGSLVYRIAYQVMSTWADTEDAVQEVFV